jgi:hypothetical protein
MGNTLLQRPPRYDDLCNRWKPSQRSAPAVRPLQGFWGWSGDEGHEVPAATWLPGRSDRDGCALVPVAHATHLQSDRLTAGFRRLYREGDPGCGRQPRTRRRKMTPMLYVICIIHMSRNSAFPKC